MSNGVAFKAFMKAAAPYLSAGSALVSAAGAIGQGKAAQNAANVQAQLYERQAQRDREIGALNARRQREEAERLAGTQRALLGSQEGGSGSALLVQEDLGAEGEFNARLAEANAEAVASSKMTQAVLSRAEGRGARQASYFRAGTALLKGASAWG